MNFKAYDNLSTAYLINKNLSSALKTSQYVIDKADDRNLLSEAHYKLGMIYEENGNINEALKHYQSASQINYKPIYNAKILKLEKYTFDQQK